MNKNDLKKCAPQKSVIAPREFNSLEFIDGRVTKTSTRSEKFYDEIQWFKNAPQSVRAFLPKVYETCLDENALKLTLEHLRSPTLSELFLNDELPLAKWREILTCVIEAYMAHFRSVRSKGIERLSVDDVNAAFRSHYIDKTRKRVEALKEISSFKEVMSLHRLHVNGREFAPFHETFFPLAERMINRITRHEDLSFVHGDFCFSNILFNLEVGNFKVIDPRGSFGSYKDFGDYKYDLAKLYHSGSGLYDLVTNDRFELSQEGDHFSLRFDISERQQGVGPLLKTLLNNLSEIAHDELLFIEATLFSSMVPLHTDSLQRMKAFYCLASEKLDCLSQRLF